MHSSIRGRQIAWIQIIIDRPLPQMGQTAEQENFQSAARDHAVVGLLPHLFVMRAGDAAGRAALIKLNDAKQGSDGRVEPFWRILKNRGKGSARKFCRTLVHGSSDTPTVNSK